MTVVDMIEEMIRVNSPKKFEGILDTASLKELNQHYDRMSSSVEETKVKTADNKDELLYPLGSRLSISDTDDTGLSWTVTNWSRETVWVRSPFVKTENQQIQPTPSFDSYSIHTGEIKI